MSEKFKNIQSLESFAGLNASYNKLKTSGSLLLNTIRTHLEDDEIGKIFSLSDHKFESFIIEIFDLRFLIRLEIDLIPQSKIFKHGRLSTYFMDARNELTKTKIIFKYDEDGQLFWMFNDGLKPDFLNVEDFVVEFIRLLMEHIIQHKYTVIPSATFGKK